LALKLHVIHAKEFVQMTPEGEYDFESTRDMLIEAVAASAKSPDHEILLDLRGARADLNMVDVYYLAAELDRRSVLSRERIALLVTPEQKWDQAKFFELCAVNRGLDVGAFNSYEEAISWLFPSSEVPNGEDGKTD
jgi:hypothetical protein